MARILSRKEIVIEMLQRFINKLKLKKWKRDGLIIGDNFNLERGSKIDSAFPWLIEIGNNVTLAPETLILSHDGSTKKVTNYTKIGNVIIKDNVFIGARSIILPNTIIGNNVIVGSNSVVIGNIPDDVVIAGNPAKIICTVEEFKNKHSKKMAKGILYDHSYKKRNNKDLSKRNKMKEELKEKVGYIF